MNKFTTQPSLAGGHTPGVSPVLAGPKRDMTDIGLVAGVLLILAIIIGGLWMYSEQRERNTRSSEPMTQTAVTASPQLMGAPTVLPVLPLPLVGATPGPDQLHADIYFDFDRARLDTATKALLDERGQFLKDNPDWAVLLQGYADPSGAAAYNKALGLRRAETVKKHLVALGVAETSIKVVSLGSEGSLCLDGSPDCRRLNRRVHLEMIKVGAEHLIPPPVPQVPAMKTSTDLTPIDGSTSLEDGEPIGSDTRSEGVSSFTEESPVP
jgi:peptidoglycan-associated lipoprotein